MVTPKFQCFNLPNTNSADARFILEQLLRSALKKRIDEKKKLEKDVLTYSNDIFVVIVCKLSSENQQFHLWGEGVSSRYFHFFPISNNFCTRLSEQTLHLNYPMLYLRIICI